MKVTLYTTHCPKCNVIEQKLKAKTIEYEEITDIELIEKKGFKQVPVLIVDDEIMDFVTANKWVNDH